MNICVNWLFKNLGIENAFEHVLVCVASATILPCTPALCYPSLMFLSQCCCLFSLTAASCLDHGNVLWGGRGIILFFPPHFLMLSTHWLNFGPCGYFHQSHSYTGLHLCRMFSLRGFSLLFLMLKWPLVVKYSHCTFLSLVLQSTTDADDWEPSETAFSG